MIKKHTEERPTRLKIITLLKKNEYMTVAELSRKTDITPMAVRQHLMALERNGMVKYEAKRNGIGRPVFIYRLTNKATDYFPKAYKRFMGEMFSLIEETHGNDRLVELLDMRYKKHLERLKPIVHQGGTLKERLEVLVKELNKEGCMVELHKAQDAFTLNLHNCVLDGVAQRHRELCNFEKGLYSELLGTDVQLLQCQQDGAHACSFLASARQ